MTTLSRSGHHALYHSGRASRHQGDTPGNVCPWCGSELVRRNGKYGPFMGCGSYPKCRFTRDA